MTWRERYWRVPIVWLSLADVGRHGTGSHLTEERTVEERSVDNVAGNICWSLLQIRSPEY